MVRITGCVVGTGGGWRVSQVGDYVYAICLSTSRVIGLDALAEAQQMESLTAREKVDWEAGSLNQATLS
jgi:hypothetical protein